MGYLLALCKKNLRIEWFIFLKFTHLRLKCKFTAKSQQNETFSGNFKLLSVRCVICFSSVQRYFSSKLPPTSVILSFALKTQSCFVARSKPVSVHFFDAEKIKHGKIYTGTRF